MVFLDNEPQNEAAYDILVQDSHFLHLRGSTFTTGSIAVQRLSMLQT